MSVLNLSESEKWELLAGRVLGDLSEDEADQVEVILANDNEHESLWRIERTAASVQLSLYSAGGQGQSDSMPVEVAQEIRKTAKEWVAKNQSSSLGAIATTPELGDVERSADRRSEDRSRASGREWVAWLCAAAALLLAVTLWQKNLPETSPSPREARLSMLSNSVSLIRASWASGKTPFDQEVTGDVVWDPKSQSGFMRFEEMPVNDPSVEQYQLWIIDPERDDEPIDGGVFNVGKSGEVIVPIDAKLEVIAPAAFAITIEKPGGVVVSTQERLPLLAAVK